MDWLPYDRAYPNSSLTANLWVRRGLFHGRLAPRDVIAYLPPSHMSGGRRYPVLYMQDGHNLFDPATAFGGVHWAAAEAATALAERGLEAIVVGIPCDGQHRFDEYGPWPEPRLERLGQGVVGGWADEYLDFLIGTVKPLVDSSFRTRPEASSTGIAGASMGGVVSLWAALERPEVFGCAAAFSPALDFGGGRLLEAMRDRGTPARVYLDMGALEGTDEALATLGCTVAHARQARDALTAHGVDLMYLEDPTGEHHERDWRRRFPAVLEWFIRGAVVRPRPDHPGPSSPQS